MLHSLLKNQNQGNGCMLKIYKTLSLATLASITCFLMACSVKIHAPDKPIKVDLNVKVNQEVHVKVSHDVDQAISKNPDLY